MTKTKTHETPAKQIMAAARHLNRSRMGWVAARWTSGIDWTGSTKGAIAESLANGSWQWTTSPRPVGPRDLERICADMRTQKNSKGEMGAEE